MSLDGHTKPSNSSRPTPSWGRSARAPMSCLGVAALAHRDACAGLEDPEAAEQADQQRYACCGRSCPQTGRRDAHGPAISRAKPETASQHGRCPGSDALEEWWTPTCTCYGYYCIPGLVVAQPSAPLDRVAEHRVLRSCRSPGHCGISPPVGAVNPVIHQVSRPIRSRCAPLYSPTMRWCPMTGAGSSVDAGDTPSTSRRAGCTRQPS